MCHQATREIGRGVYLPSFAERARELIGAEQGRGWLDDCDEAGRFLALSQELVDALSSVLRSFAKLGPVLEVCSGSGSLARALNTAGVDVRATDANPPHTAQRVCRMTAQAALNTFRPAVVLGSFVPHDAGVDEAVLACPSVQHYFVLNARIGGSCASWALWHAPGWHAQPAPHVGVWMITRHDVWLGSTDAAPGPLISQHGEAWHFTRRPSKH